MTDTVWAMPPDSHELSDPWILSLRQCTSLLQRVGVAPMDEFAEMLGLFAETVADAEPEEGAILQAWAAAIRRTRVN
jgi:hypothetical protein